MTDIPGSLHKFELGGAYRYTALAAAVIPTASGDGRIIARLLIRTDDPHARHLVMDLAPMALAGLIRTCASIEQASASGEIRKIAEQLDIATQVDQINEASADPRRGKEEDTR